MWVTDESVHSVIANCMKEMIFFYDLPDLFCCLSEKAPTTSSSWEKLYEVLLAHQAMKNYFCTNTCNRKAHVNCNIAVNAADCFSSLQTEYYPEDFPRPDRIKFEQDYKMTALFIALQQLLTLQFPSSNEYSDNKNHS